MSTFPELLSLNHVTFDINVLCNYIPKEPARLYASLFFNFQISISNGSAGPFAKMTPIQEKSYLTRRNQASKALTGLSCINLDYEDQENSVGFNKLLIASHKTLILNSPLASARPLQAPNIAE